jgi:hypothetical protein
MNEIKLNKSNLNKIIKWSTSRYNVCSKKRAIEWALKCLNDGFYEIADEKRYSIILSSGSYCECSAMTTTGEYVIDLKEKIIREVTLNLENEVEKIHKEWRLI